MPVAADERAHQMHCPEQQRMCPEGGPPHTGVRRRRSSGCDAPTGLECSESSVPAAVSDLKPAERSFSSVSVESVSAAAISDLQPSESSFGPVSVVSSVAHFVATGLDTASALVLVEASHAIEVGHAAQALAGFQEVLQAYPECPMALAGEKWAKYMMQLIRAHKLYEAGQWQQALQYYQEVLRARPGLQEALVNVRMITMQHGLEPGRPQTDEGRRAGRQQPTWITKARAVFCVATPSNATIAYYVSLMVAFVGVLTIFGVAFIVPRLRNPPLDRAVLCLGSKCMCHLHGADLDDYSGPLHLPDEAWLPFESRRQAAVMCVDRLKERLCSKAEFMGFGNFYCRPGWLADDVGFLSAQVPSCGGLSHPFGTFVQNLFKNRFAGAWCCYDETEGTLLV